ncbi:tail fiber domain-containing protein [Lyngbya aestuarii]|uniref:tail fiber domain-containing protein n=1 Tax=Lyngbya aestuarii TaxID=118322 RepID=UPI00403DE3D1
MSELNLSNYVTLKSNGYVGIGATEPTGNLQIDGTLADAKIKFGGNGGDVHHISSARDIVFNATKNAASNSIPSFFFRMVSDFNNLSSYTDVASINSKGDLSIKGKLIEASSRELKDSIVELPEQEAMAALEKLNPVKFFYKADRERNLHVGFIAEDVPDLLATSDRKGVSSMDIVAVLTQVVKEQQKTMTALVEKVKILETQVTADMG